jgi:D-3-phosphoglycerate dehydrogenase / 2-oxoglutarate reductase
MKVGYFLRANESVYEVIRSYLPVGAELITLQGKEPSEEVELIRELDFLISVRATTEMIGNGGKLRLLQLPGVGLDQVDLEAAANARIPVALSLNGSSEAVAEQTMLLMLAVCRRLVELANSVREGKWLMWDRRTVSYGLFGKTLGIIGLGRIGREVAARAEAFGMSVQYFDTMQVDGFTFRDLPDLLRTSDVVSLHCPLAPGTRRLLNRDMIQVMKRGAILINTARGGLIDETALAVAISSGKLAGAGLDVLEVEPPSLTNPLLRLEEVIISPHVGTGTIDSLRVKAEGYSRNIRRVLAGEEPLGLVKPATIRQ